MGWYDEEVAWKSPWTESVVMILLLLQYSSHYDPTAVQLQAPTTKWYRYPTESEVQNNWLLGKHEEYMLLYKQLTIAEQRLNTMEWRKDGTPCKCKAGRYSMVTCILPKDVFINFFPKIHSFRWLTLIKIMNKNCVMLKMNSTVHVFGKPNYLFLFVPFWIYTFIDGSAVMIVAFIVTIKEMGSLSPCDRWPFVLILIYLENKISKLRCKSSAT